MSASNEKNNSKNYNDNNTSDEKNKWNKRDFITIIISLIITIVFSLRQGTPDFMIKELIKQLWAYSIYSVATVLIIIGLTKKIFRYNTTLKQIIKWSFMLGAFCAVSQFFHELFLYFSKN